MLCFGSILQAQSEQLVETRTLDSFDKIIATNGINVLLRQGSEEKVEVRITNALLSDVSSVVSKGTLKLKMRPQINKDISVIVIVHYKSLEKISASKGATIETKTLILTDRMDISASTGASIKAEIECAQITASAGGGSTLSLYGWAERFEISANSKAEVNCKTLKADNILARSATGAEVWVNPKDYLEAVVNTGGIIYYTNEPTKKNEKISSGGEVIKKIEKIGDDLIRNI